MMSLSREMFLRLSSLLRALLEGSPSYKYDMRPSGKRYEVLIVVIVATTPLLRYSDSVLKYMTRLLVVMSEELFLS